MAKKYTETAMDPNETSRYFYERITMILRESPLLQWWEYVNTEEAECLANRILDAVEYQRKRRALPPE